MSARPTNGYFLGLIVTGVITFIGLRACFKMNERGDNQHFLDRYICLSVPLFIWSYLLYVLLFYISYAASHALWGKDISRLFSGLGPAVLLLTCIMLIVHFVALRHFIGKAAMPSKA
jgi:predicted Co/Zn/Cd cation transporter (cation efflux family)